MPGPFSIPFLYFNPPWTDSGPGTDPGLVRVAAVGCSDICMVIGRAPGQSTQKNHKKKGIFSLKIEISLSFDV